MTGRRHLYMHINASFLCLVFRVFERIAIRQLQFGRPGMLHCSRDVGKCADSVCLGRAEVVLHKQ